MKIKPWILCASSCFFFLSFNSTSRLTLLHVKGIPVIVYCNICTQRDKRRIHFSPVLLKLQFTCYSKAHENCHLSRFTCMKNKAPLQLHWKIGSRLNWSNSSTSTPTGRNGEIGQAPQINKTVRCFREISLEQKTETKISLAFSIHFLLHDSSICLPAFTFLLYSLLFVSRSIVFA